MSEGVGAILAEGVTLSPEEEDFIYQGVLNSPMGPLNSTIEQGTASNSVPT